MAWNRLLLFPALAAAQEELRVRRVCVKNLAGFEMRFEAEDMVTGQISGKTDGYPISQTRCQDLASLPDIQDGHEVKVRIFATGGKVSEVDETVIFDGGASDYVSYGCRGSTQRYDCDAKLHKPAAVSKVCVHNKAGFSMSFDLQNSQAGEELERSERFRSLQARCVNISEFESIRPGDFVNIHAHPVGGRAAYGSLPVEYDDKSLAWATYTCWGSTLEFSCEMLTDQDAPPNQPLPFNKNECYMRPTYAKEEIQVQRNIHFGRNVNPYTFQWEKAVDLELDLYLPPDSDRRSQRPLAVMMHGGAFVWGVRAQDEALYYEMAQRGYVVATIDYRLVPIFPILSAIATMNDPAALVAQVAAEDARAAVRFLRKNANKWRLDSERIAVGGTSAGALSANMYAYGKGLTEGHSGHEGDADSHIHATFSISGGLRAKCFCSQLGGAPDYKPSGCVINGPELQGMMQPGDVPGLFLHGTTDKIVPYYGSFLAEQRAQEVGVNHVLLNYEGVGHITYDVDVQIVVNETHYGSEFNAWVDFLSGALNTGEAECPGRSTVV